MNGNIGPPFAVVGSLGFVMTSRWLLIALVTLTGCGGEVDNRTVDPTRGRLIALGQAYGRHLATKGKVPTKLADLEPELKELGNPEELSKSARDGQPFVILWGTRFTEKEAKIYIHEKEGQGGKRYVLMTDNATLEVPDDRFQTMPKVK